MSVENKSVFKTNLGLHKDCTYQSKENRNSLYKWIFKREIFLQTLCKRVYQNKKFSKKTLFPSQIEGVKK